MNSETENILINNIQEQFDRVVLTLQTNPYKYSFFSLMRQLDKLGVLDDSLTLQGSIKKVRFGQLPSLSFPTSSINSVDLKNDTAMININGFGMLGVNSPLPLHFIEYVFTRKYQYGDDTWTAFINVLHHRLFLLFYTAWKNAQTFTALEDNSYNNFSKYIASFIGLRNFVGGQMDEDVHIYSKLYYSGFLYGNKSSSQNIAKVISSYFDVKCQIKENIGHWVNIPETDMAPLGKINNSLGDGVLLGVKVFDVLSKFKIILGPLSYSEYVSFFKHSDNMKKLKHWVETFVGVEYSWDLQLILRQEEVPLPSLNGQVSLGLTSWLGNVNQDVDDFVMSC